MFITQKRAVKKEHSNTKERRHKETNRKMAKVNLEISIITLMWVV